jgi:hypothetical protein
MFSDDADNLGLFEGSEQVQQMRKIDYQQDPDGKGLHAHRLCEKCAIDVTILIPWDELYCVSKGVLPQKVHPKFRSAEWLYNPQIGKMYPKVLCHCGHLAAFPMSPGDAMRRLQQAKEGNTMSGDQLQSCQQLAQAFAARSAQPAKRR